jgi:hypothetical protein
MTTTDNPTFGQLRRTQFARAIGETRMYLAIVATVFASTVFIPSFIGIRARTNADWRSR